MKCLDCGDDNALRDGYCRWCDPPMLSADFDGPTVQAGPDRCAPGYRAPTCDGTCAHCDEGPDEDHGAGRPEFTYSW